MILSKRQPRSYGGGVQAIEDADSPPDIRTDGMTIEELVQVLVSL